ncbi:MAG TPA: hypothetical protein VNC50_02135, partial [Planctomycetia bacterium]|nr:hypothetical protein [Planctomycetia bacterium]
PEGVVPFFRDFLVPANRRQAEEAFELLGKNLTAVEARPRAKDAASLKSQAVLVERASRGLAAACALRGDHEGASKWKTRADGVGREFSVAPAAKPASKAPKAAKTAP